MGISRAGLILVFGIGVVLGLQGSPGLADPAADIPPPASPPEGSEVSTPQTPVSQDASSGIKKRRTRGKRASEKETDGSEAPNRFEADTVIKSKYTLHGEPLEVDPD